MPNVMKPESRDAFREKLEDQNEIKPMNLLIMVIPEKKFHVAKVVDTIFDEVLR